MKLASKQVAAVAFSLVLLPSAGVGQDTAADEQQIRDLEQQWLAAVEERDLDAIVALFAEDGRILPPNAEPAMGRDSVREAWSGILELPELEPSFAPTDVRVADSGDIAYTIGTYQLAFEDEGEPVQDSGKYVDIWEKVDGEWKMMVEMYNSNLPPE
ncbi:MAG: YybH family protein [Hyphomicrobiales bacterium]